MGQPLPAWIRQHRRQRIEALWDEDGPIPDEVMERLLAIKPIDGVTALEAASLRSSLAHFETCGEDKLATAVRDILRRYDNAPEQTLGEDEGETRFRDCQLTIADRISCEQAAQVLTAADYPVRYGAQSFSCLVNRLWELRGVYSRLSALAS